MLLMYCEYKQEILNSVTLVSNVCLCFCRSSGPKFNSAIRGKIGLPHSIKLRFLSFLYFFTASLILFFIVRPVYLKLFGNLVVNFFTADDDPEAKVLSEKTRALLGSYFCMFTVFTHP